MEDLVAEELEEPVELKVTEFGVGTGMSGISRKLYPHCCDKRSYPGDPNTAGGTIRDIYCTGSCMFFGYSSCRIRCSAVKGRADTWGIKANRYGTKVCKIGPRAILSKKNSDRKKQVF